MAGTGRCAGTWRGHHASLPEDRRQYHHHRMQTCQHHLVKETLYVERGLDRNWFRLIKGNMISRIYQRRIKYLGDTQTCQRSRKRVGNGLKKRGLVRSKKLTPTTRKMTLKRNVRNLKGHTMNSNAVCKSSAYKSPSASSTPTRRARNVLPAPYS